MTLGIIATNILVYLLVNVAQITDSSFANVAFGHVPSVANDIRTLPTQYQIIPEYLYSITAITAAFLHADIMHLGGNMLFIWVFGDNIEDAMGHVRFLLFFLLCAFIASWFHAFSFPQSDAPLIGASGAAAGIVAAYLMLHPRVKIWVLFLGRIPLKLPAYVLIGLWIAFQVVMYLSASDSKVSWAAHVGGIIAGIVLVGLFKRRGVPLFDTEIIIPKTVELEPSASLPPNIKPAPPSPRQTKWGRKAAKPADE